MRLGIDVYNRAKQASDELGTSAAWVIAQAVNQVLDLADAKGKPRVVPRLVKALDGVRAPDVILSEPGGERSKPGAGLRVGQG